MTTSLWRAISSWIAIVRATIWVDMHFISILMASNHFFWFLAADFPVLCPLGLSVGAIGGGLAWVTWVVEKHAMLVLLVHLVAPIWTIIVSFLDATRNKECWHDHVFDNGRNKAHQAVHHICVCYTLENHKSFMIRWKQPRELPYNLTIVTYKQQTNHCSSIVLEFSLRILMHH